MQAATLSYKKSSIRYYRFGQGSSPVICFHGYGEEAKSFQFLDKIAGAQYTFYSLDLPFHGGTNWNEGIIFNISDLQSIVSKILALHQPDYENQQLILLGYSLGGRIALRLYEADPGRIRKLVLIAPDGLVLNPWYWFSTQTSMGNKMFRYTMKHPQWFFSLLNGFYKMKLVNASVYKFVNYYNDDEEARHMLYTRWTSLRKIRPDLEKVKEHIRMNKTPVRLIYGKHDRIILPVRGELFQKGIEPFCSIKILNSGHQLLTAKYGAEIVDALNE